MEKKIEIEISLPKSPQFLPVWDNWVDKIIIDHRIPTFLVELLEYCIKGYIPLNKPFKFSSDLEDLLNDKVIPLVSYHVLRKYRLSYTKLIVVRRLNNLVISPELNTKYFDIFSIEDEIEIDEK